MKKTIFVVYTNTISKKNITDRNMKRYAFNTESDVEVGTVIKSNSYTTAMTVVAVLDKEFKYYDRVSGVLSNEITSTNAYEIKTMKIVDEASSEVIIAERYGVIS